MDVHRIFYLTRRIPTVVSQPVFRGASVPTFGFLPSVRPPGSWGSAPQCPGQAVGRAWAAVGRRGQAWPVAPGSLRCAGHSREPGNTQSPKTGAGETPVQFCSWFVSLAQCPREQADPSLVHLWTWRALRRPLTRCHRGRLHRAIAGPQGMSLGSLPGRTLGALRSWGPRASLFVLF